MFKSICMTDNLALCKDFFTDTVMRLQFILLPTPKPLYICSLNQTACRCVMFCFLLRLFSGSDAIPQWWLPSGCVKSLDGQSCQVSIFLVFPAFKQQQPTLQQPGGMCANSNSPVGRLAITAPLLYPCNCKGSCFLSDQTASLPPGRLASSPLAASGK